MAQLQCILVTPEATLRDQPADFVALPLLDGEIGIARDHSPMIGQLGCGEMRIRRGDHTGRFYVDGGFVQVIRNVVSVLTNHALLAEELDAAAAQEQLRVDRARPAKTPELMAQRDLAVARSRARLRVARRAAS